jgi:hypothetical protein
MWLIWMYIERVHPTSRQIERSILFVARSDGPRVQAPQTQGLRTPIGLLSSCRASMDVGRVNCDGPGAQGQLQHNARLYQKDALPGVNARLRIGLWWPLSPAVCSNRPPAAMSHTATDNTHRHGTHHRQC